jgi:hypothetical protein
VEEVSDCWSRREGGVLFEVEGQAGSSLKRAHLHRNTGRDGFDSQYLPPLIIPQHDRTGSRTPIRSPQAHPVISGRYEETVID